MASRGLVFLLTVGCSAALAQVGLYGPASAHPKAGDAAPPLVFTRMWNGGAEGGVPNLTGQMTVMAFYPDTVDNLESVAKWNALIDRFAGKPVQFVWVTGEKDAAFPAWLSAHPIHGWVALDVAGGTGRSYGMDLPSAVIVGADGKIVGFDDSILPEARTVTAALAGKVITTAVKRSELEAFGDSGKVRLSAEPRHMPGPDDEKPNFPPSYALHVSPSKGEDRGSFRGMDYWSLRDFSLMEAIAELYELSPSRIRLPASLDDQKRYNFAMVLPEAEPEERMRARFREGLQEQFHFVATRVSLPLDVYVVTAPNLKPGAVPKERLAVEGSRLMRSSSVGSVEFQVAHVAGSKQAFEDGRPAVGLSAIRGVAMEGTMDDFCRQLEEALDRPVVNESNVAGEFVFQIQADRNGENDFLERLRSQMGIVITPAQRSTVILEVRSLQR